MKILAPAILCFLLAACGKSDEISPVITLNSPQDNQAFTGGSLVNISATITDNEGIHMVHVSVTDNTTGGHLVHFEEHVDGKTFNVNQSFTAASGRSYLIEIESHDHADNSTKKELTVSGN